MSEVFHLVVADADVYLAASEYVLEQVQVVCKALEVLEIVGLLAVSVTYTHPIAPIATSRGQQSGRASAQP